MEIELGCPFCGASKKVIERRKEKKYCQLCQTSWLINEEKGQKKMEENKTLTEKIKTFYNNHENTILIVVALIVIDYLFNDGKVQGKIRINQFLHHLRINSM